MRTVHSVSVNSEDPADWAAALSGDGEAFGRVFDAHHAQVRRHSARLVRRAADADDVMAITFLEAWRKRAQVRVVDDSVLPWLLVTATNVASNINRGARRYRALLDRLPSSEWVADPLSENDDAEAVAALAKLSRADRSVVVLCVLEGFSEREAAEALGVPQGTVKSRLSRAKQRLRKQISDPSTTRPLTEEVGQ